MYAVIRTGGKQYQVAPGQRCRVEKLAGNVGDTLELDDVLLVVDGEKVPLAARWWKGPRSPPRLSSRAKTKKSLSSRRNGARATG